MLKTALSEPHSPTKTKHNMKHTQTLQDFEQTFDAYHELDSDGFYVEQECFLEFCDEYVDKFSGPDKVLMWGIDDLMIIAEEHFDAISKQEEADERRDQAAYLSSEGNH